MTVGQGNLSLEVFSTLGDNALGIESMSWQMKLGQPFLGEINLISSDPEIAIKDLLYQSLSIKLISSSDTGEWFHGFVTKFQYLGPTGKYFQYRATLMSCIGLLAFAGGYRIYQDLSTPDIIKKVFENYGLTASLESKLTQTYTPRGYCVQFGESDFAFLHRLMEEEGIYYYFEFAQDKHSLILADDLSPHTTTAGYETVPYREELHAGTQESIQFWNEVAEFGTGTYWMNDYDFTKPKSPLLVSQASSVLSSSPFPNYSYPGNYQEKDAGQRLTRLMMEAHDASRFTTQMKGNARGLRSGVRFTLSDHPIDAANREYLVTESFLYVQNDGIQTGSRRDFAVEVNVKCQDTTLPFRSARRTTRPVAAGPQVAVVVGKAGEDIWTDSYGRIKVQFPWDRDGKNDETSSCWVRVSQSMIGKNWGAMSLPRIGDEVVVDFLDGNPDCPIVTGRVYNAERMPPDPLPDNQAKTIFRTRSTKGGDATAFHEWTFDDTKDSESILVHSERDFIREVENNDSLKVGFDKMTPGDRTVQVYNNESVQIGLGSGSGTYSLEAAQSIELKCGSSSLLITKTDIQLTATNITLSASGNLDQKGSNVSVAADANLKLNGNAGSNLESGANVVIKGAMVQIN